jgi:hypothetical protein
MHYDTNPTNSDFSQPKIEKIFEGLSEKEGFYSSKDFLPQVSKASKPNMCNCSSKVRYLMRHHT